MALHTRILEDARPPVRPRRWAQQPHKNGPCRRPSTRCGDVARQQRRRSASSFCSSRKRCCRMPFHYDTGFVEQLRAGPSPSTVAFTPRTANAATGVTEARGPGQPVKFPAELGDIAERALMAFRDGDLSDTNVIIYMEKLEEYFLFLAGCDPDATFRHAEKLLNDAKTAEKAQNKLLKILGELLQAIEWQLRTPFELEFEALKQLVVSYRLNTFRRQLFNYGFRKVPDLEDVYTNAALSKRSAMCLADQVLALKRTATQSTTRQPRSAEGVEGLSIGLEQLAELVWAACGRILRDAVNEEVFDDAADDV
eukprot:Opistho-1_new@7010